MGFVCDGHIKALVEPLGAKTGGALPLDALTQLVAQREAFLPVAYVADLNSAERWLDYSQAFPERLWLDRSSMEDDGRTYVSVYNPPLRMFVIGGVNIVQLLVPIAQARS